jgi:ubiquinone/menaquinone biosynthesis C-methylase UbiE
MILRAREKGAPGAWLRADARHLPFAAQSFDLCFGCYMLHYIDDLNALASECARVLRTGCAAFITASHEFIERHPMNRYFPSFAAIDKARFPDINVVKDGLARAGFLEPAVERLAVPQPPIDANYLTRVENRFISTFDLLPEEEFNAGLTRLRTDIQTQGSLDIENVWESVVVWARKGAE